MQQIKFSHYYIKFHGCFAKNKPKSAFLLQAIKINFNDLSEEFIKQDTGYLVRQSKRIFVYNEYFLPKTDLILLIFGSNKNVLFTTFRRFTPKKWEYYKNSEGKEFEITIEEKK